MSVQHPVTLSEWEAYINGLSGKVLREAAMAANSVDFVRQLESEKIDHGVIGSIFSMFAQRLREDDQIVPRAAL